MYQKPNNAITGKFERFTNFQYPDLSADFLSDLNSAFGDANGYISDYLVGTYSVTPSGHSGKFPLLITHDVDHLNKANFSGKLKKSMSRDASFFKSIKIFGSGVKRYFATDNWSTLDNILSTHKEMGTKGTFFFMSDRLMDRSYKDGYYPLKAVDPSKFVDHSIGVHFQRAAVRSSHAFSLERDRLEKHFGRKITFSRSHHLYFDNVETPLVLSSNGITLDFSLGLNDYVGFRRGTGWPIVLDVAGEETLFVSTQIQDTALFRHKSANIEAAKRVISRCSKMGYPLVLLWHNCWERDGLEEAVIRSLIDYAQSQGGVSMSADEFYSNALARLPRVTGELNGEKMNLSS